MIAEQKHIIHKVFLEVNTNSTHVANNLKDNLHVFLKEDILPYLEQYIKSIEYKLPLEIIQIPQLSLNIEVDSNNHLESIKTETKQKLVKQIEHLLESPKSSEEVALIPVQEHQVNALLYFIEHGYAPWWKTSQTKTMFTEVDFKYVSNNHKLKKQFFTLLKNTSAKKRCVLQFSNSELKLLLHHVFSDNPIVNIVNKDLLVKISKINAASRVVLWTAIIDFLLTKNETDFVRKIHVKFKSLSKTNDKNVEVVAEIMLMILQQLETIKKETIINILKKPSTSKRITETQADYDNSLDESLQEETQNNQVKSYYVQNAGLVIVHPYLSRFLQNCKLLDERNKFIDKEMAIHALHYLATKKEQQYESNMVFEKFLCGMPIESSINRHVKLSDNIKNQAEELLSSILNNWSVLGNASTDLLRHEFLTREGKLSFKNDNPKITLERKTQDILIDKLPWGISLFKLPWFNHLIFTDW